MTSLPPVRSTAPPRRARWLRLAGPLAALAAGLAVLGHGPPASSSSVLARPSGIPWREHRAALGEAGGAVPGGTTVFDDAVPGVARLDPALLGALRRAARAAAAGGLELRVDSGWRSPAYQRHLLDEAVARYGSAREAARWVATPQTSAHVKGQAVDIGPPSAADWLSEHGAAYGLCRVYGNEPWHYERRPAAVARGCPSLYADPTQDPRTQG